jgi:aryl-alcohol dehydrogenase-like predicted oxidoreductase
MVRGDPLDQERTVARAIDTGVNYFDTAVQYGNGESEKNLGRVLQSLKPADVIVGTKVRLPSGDFVDIADTVGVARRQSRAATPRPGRHLPPAQCDPDRRRGSAQRPAGAR